MPQLLCSCRHERDGICSCRGRKRAILCGSEGPLFANMRIAAARSVKDTHPWCRQRCQRCKKEAGIRPYARCMIDRPARVLVSEHKLVIPVHGSRIYIAIDVQVHAHGHVRRVRAALAWTHGTAGMGCKGDRQHARKLNANKCIIHGEEAVNERVEIEPSIWMIAAHVDDQATFCWTRRI